MAGAVMGQSKLQGPSVSCVKAWQCSSASSPSLSMGRSIQQDCGCCAANHTPLQRSKAISVPCFQTQIGIWAKKIILRLSGQQQKEHLHLLLKAGRSSALGMAPAQSPGAVLAPLGTLCSLAFPWCRGLAGDPSAGVSAGVAGLQPHS